jgi:hypothetical protein
VKPAKPALEPICLAVEPVALRTAAAIPAGKSKLTVLSPAEETESGLKILDFEQFKSLGLTQEEFLAKSRAAAARLLARLQPEVVRDKRGGALYAKLTSESHLTSSVILCPEFRNQFEKLLGPNLLVAVPDRFTVYVFDRRMGEFQKMGREIAGKYFDATYPASSEAFEFKDGELRAAGSFDLGESPRRTAPKASAPAPQPAPAPPKASPAPASASPRG